MTGQGVGSIRLVALECSASLTQDRAAELLQGHSIRVPRPEVWDSLWPAIEQTAKLLMRLPRDPPFGSYLITDPESREVVGICGFKEAPKSGMVEIAYHVFPDFERKGYGTAAAMALRDLAFTSPLVQKVTARTLREKNASTRILARCEFSLVGDVNDPEDGLVWEWQFLRRSSGTLPV